MKKSLRLVFILILALVLAAATYAMAAANTVPETNVGDGSAAISGYAVTNVRYTLNATNPSVLDSVAFTISPTNAFTVRVKLVDTGGSWHNCTNSGGSVTCNLGGAVSALAANNLQVVAAQ